MHYKIAAAAIAAAGLTLAGGSVASAAPTPANVIGPVVGTTDGTAGIISTDLGHFYNRKELTFTITAAADNLGVTASLAKPNGAEGTGLCSNGEGQAAEEGVLNKGQDPSQPPGTYNFEIAFALGALKPNGADPCVNNGVLNNGAPLHPMLSDLVVGDAVTLLIQQYQKGVLFWAENLTTGQSFEQEVATQTCTPAVWHPGHWVPGHWVGSPGHRTWIHGFWIAGHLTPRSCTGTHPYYDESLDGVLQDLQGLGGPASNDLVDFSNDLVNGHPVGDFNDEIVDSSGTGNAPWLAGVADTTSTGPNGEPCANGEGTLLAGGSTFSVCVATPTGA